MNPELPIRLLTPRQVSEMLAVPVQTLAHWRTSRLVPLPYVKVGGKHVRYRLSDVIAYLDARTVG